MLAFGVLAECAGGKGVAPYFTTGAGGALQTILFGFAGIKIPDEGIKEGKKALPQKWESLEVTL